MSIPERPPRILVVDDEEQIRRALRSVLAARKYDVRLASNGEEAIDTAIDFAPELVILDLAMPGMDGLEFLNALRLLNPSVPVIMLTAYGAVESYLKSLSLGVFEYLNKPIKAKELGRIVQAALESVDTGRMDSGSTEGSKAG